MFINTVATQMLSTWGIAYGLAPLDNKWKLQGFEVNGFAAQFLGTCTDCKKKQK
jgi:hypothetical protein